jgi:cytochrome c oxidase subunit 3
VKRPFELDVSQLPTYGFGTRMTMWWGTLGFCVLEGTGFALAAAAYLFLWVNNPDWPIETGPPGLLWSSLVLLVMLASLWPNLLATRNARREDLPRVRRDLVILSAIGLLILVLRWYEFTTLGVAWDRNVYGSIVWVLLGLHTAHVLTDLGDTIVLTVLMFTRHGHGKRFSDVEDNAFYWNFVVLAWALLYALLYWAPRL